MPHWYWEKKELRSTPSQAANLEYETEMRYRREGVRFIVELGKALNLSHTTMASGAVYFHRFYMFHSFFDFSKVTINSSGIKREFLMYLRHYKRSPFNIHSKFALSDNLRGDKKVTSQVTSK